MRSRPLPTSSTEPSALTPTPLVTFENELPLFDVAWPMRVWKFPFASIVLPA